MSLYIASLNSGSNGNCYYIGNNREAVLIDAGLSCKETERRLRNLGLSIANVKAIFISHEHIDHIKGMQGITNKHEIPIYITPLTLQYCRTQLPDNLVRTFKPYEQVRVGGLTVIPFPKQHDGIDPYSFNIEGNGVTIGVYTDIGAPCDHLIANFKKCHAAFLEANYDEIMLEYGSYPAHLKKRIKGGKGHLSNRQAFDFFTTHRPPHLTHLLLAHLSKNNNKPEIVAELFKPCTPDTNVIIASRFNETEVYRITGNNTMQFTEHTAPPEKMVQATLF